MNLNQLRYFNAICIYKTVSEASEYLHISQPSLSNAIKELENEFGVKLFLRQHRGMVPTSEGEILFKMSKELLSRADEIENIMSDLGKERKVLRLGVPPMIGSIILPHIYSEFQPMYPDIHIEITEGGKRELVTKLSEDTLDMVFLPHDEFIGKNFSTVSVMEPKIVCCVSNKNPLSEKKSITASDLEGVPLVLFKDSFYHTEEVKKWFSLSNIKPQILLQTQQLSTLKSVISNNVAAGFVFRKLASEKEGFSSLETNPPMHVKVSLVWKKDAYFFSAMKKFGEYISQKEL